MRRCQGGGTKRRRHQVGGAKEEAMMMKHQVHQIHRKNSIITIVPLGLLSVILKCPPCSEII